MSAPRSCVICQGHVPIGSKGVTCGYSCRAKLREQRKTVEWRKQREYPPSIIDLARRLYLDDGLTIAEVQAQLPPGFKAQRIIARHVPQRRVAAKRDQRGPANTSWRGDAIGYDAAHERVKRERGKASAHPCCACDRPAHEWSYNGGCSRELRDATTGCFYSPDVQAYSPRCRSCHRRYDRALRASRGGDAA